MTLKEYTESIIPTLRRLFPFECKYHSQLEVESKEYDFFAKFKDIGLADGIQLLENHSFMTKERYYPKLEDLFQQVEEKPNQSKLKNRGIEHPDYLEWKNRAFTAYGGNEIDEVELLKSWLDFKGKVYSNPQELDPRLANAYRGWTPKELISLGVTPKELIIYKEMNK